ncbi:MAG: hypothetical protein OXG29_07715, partial [Gammaproteobacteria bacterium]|nr:hypothetical protein [Gammaproteobacteria bacterium]
PLPPERVGRRHVSTHNKLTLQADGAQDKHFSHKTRKSFFSEPDPKRVVQFQGLVIQFGYEAERSHCKRGERPTYQHRF